MHQSVQEGTSCHDHAFGIEFCTPDGTDTNSRLILNDEFISLILPDFKILRFIKSSTPFPDELPSVALGTGTPYGRSFTNVQHPELDGSGIRHETHLTSQGIDLAHNLPLGNTTNGRVARHLGNLVHVHRHQTGLSTHVGAGTGCLATCMSASDDNHIIFQYHILLICQFLIIIVCWRKDTQILIIFDGNSNFFCIFVTKTTKIEEIQSSEASF